MWTSSSAICGTESANRFADGQTSQAIYLIISKGRFRKGTRIYMDGVVFKFHFKHFHPFPTRGRNSLTFTVSNSRINSQKPQKQEKNNKNTRVPPESLRQESCPGNPYPSPSWLPSRALKFKWVFLWRRCRLLAFNDVDDDVDGDENGDGGGDVDDSGACLCTFRSTNTPVHTCIYTEI